MDERTRKQLEEQAIRRQEREREERRKREEAERRRREEDHKRFLMQQMALDKQKEARKQEEIAQAKKNDALLAELERKQREHQGH